MSSRQFSITFVDSELTWTISVDKSYPYDINQMQPPRLKTRCKEPGKLEESSRSANVAAKTSLWLFLPINMVYLGYKI